MMSGPTPHSEHRPHGHTETMPPPRSQLPSTGRTKSRQAWTGTSAWESSSKSPWGPRTLGATEWSSAPRKNGSLRRTIDFQQLNRHATRETHHTQSPFHQARAVPMHTKKTIFDAWNGYHSVALAESDRHYTTFITPWGRYRYRSAPQGYIASGDAYTARYDSLVSEVDNKTKCIDDALLWSTSIEDAFHRGHRVAGYLRPQRDHLESRQIPVCTRRGRICWVPDYQHRSQAMQQVPARHNRLPHPQRDHRHQGLVRAGQPGGICLLHGISHGTISEPS